MQISALLQEHAMPVPTSTVAGRYAIDFPLAPLSRFVVVRGLLWFVLFAGTTLFGTVAINSVGAQEPSESRNDQLPVPDKLVVLTFDDSARTHYTYVRPILKKYGFGGTFFITEGFDFPDNKRDYMTWEQIAELHRDGFEIGNHTRDHLSISDANVSRLADQLTAIADRCRDHEIPAPVTFAWPGNATSLEAFAVLKEHGIRFARRGGAPEYPYDQGQGFAYEPTQDHPLLLPSAGDARPDWTLDDFVRAVEQARNGRIAIVQFHGVPDTAHDWVSTQQQNFEAYMNYLAVNHFQVIALRDLDNYQGTRIEPRETLAVVRRRQAELVPNTSTSAVESGGSADSNIRLVSRIEDLPAIPASPSLPVDWLVEPVARTAGVYRGEHPHVFALDNGLLRRSFLIGPNLACVGLDQLISGESILRSIRPECQVTLDGTTFDVGGLTGQPVQNFLRPEWYERLLAKPSAYQFDGQLRISSIQPRMEWKRRDTWLSQHPEWPPKGVEVALRFVRPSADESTFPNVVVEVHYALYDGLPLIEKWITVTNVGDDSVRLQSFVSETLACVEASSQVEDVATPLHPNLHVETNFTSVSMDGAGSQRDVVHWLADPTYTTQVNYLLQSQCLLECRPPLGPNLTLKSGKSCESFRTWILAYDDRDATRQALALSRMYRTLAPWVMENPLIHHVRSADPDAVRLAIDQCADVGFELVIMTFGSGFDLENESPAYLEQVRELANYAHSKGIGLGGYSLLGSRQVSDRDDVVNPATGKPGGFARFGNSPCLESEWGQDYFRKLYSFFEQTGCDVLEHDGSYPGDACASTNHPGHEGYEDSRWRQWTKISDYYRWCRSQGIYLNVPDWYFLNGSNKTGMGYRETNWSLPREHQEIIERQNIYDGTRYKLPSMGWMFVPLTQYHGGGEAATIEPLHEHLDHYERRLQNLFGAGVQACFRGPRLFDTEQTRVVVKRWVDFYKQHRAILDSPLIGLRRADGRDWDGWLHVNPELDTPGLAMIYNPLPKAIDREITFPLRYTGIQLQAHVHIGEFTQTVELNPQHAVRLSVHVPARGAVPILFSPTQQ